MRGGFGRFGAVPAFDLGRFDGEAARGGRRGENRRRASGKGGEEVRRPVRRRAESAGGASDFAETAAFEPALAIRGRGGARAIHVPDSLTSWRVQATALTRDVKWGAYAGETATRKELMVALEMPRFFREGDHGELHVIVHNETDEALSGSATLAGLEEGDPADGLARPREAGRRASPSRRIRCSPGVGR